MSTIEYSCVTTSHSQQKSRNFHVIFQKYSIRHNWNWILTEWTYHWSWLSWIPNHFQKSRTSPVPSHGMGCNSFLCKGWKGFFEAAGCYVKCQCRKDPKWAEKLMGECKEPKVPDPGYWNLRASGDCRMGKEIPYLINLKDQPIFFLQGFYSTAVLPD